MANEQYEKLKETTIQNAMLVLKITQNGEETRQFFEMCIREAQERDAIKNSGNIMSALTGALKKSNDEGQEKLARKKKFLAEVERFKATDTERDPERRKQKFTNFVRDFVAREGPIDL